VVKAVEYGDAANGISGIETALSLLLLAVEAGVLDLATVARAMTGGPDRVLGAALDPGRATRLEVGAPADLVVVDRALAWQVGPASLLSKGHNSPLLGRDLPGRVLLTIAGGRFAYVDASLADDQTADAR
jgi:dihydroorotase